jgi:hypothetical protein
VRWVNAIWNALERTRGRPASRAPSVRSERPLSQVTRSDAGGSASTQYTPLTGGLIADSNNPTYPAHRPLYATDDQVVVTSGGFVTPLTQRGSRRLAAGGLERHRSLRRVASEADLSEDAFMPAPTPERRSVPLLDLPLTSEIARSRPGSRDFTFAGGIAPPPLIVSPPPEYSSPIGGPLQTIPESISQSMATAAEMLSMDASGQQFGTPHAQSTTGGGSTYFTPAGQSDTRSAYHTAGDHESATVAYTAREGMSTIAEGYHGNVPHVEITQASASHLSASDPNQRSTTMYTLHNETFGNTGTSPQSLRASQYTTARESVYSTAGTHLDNASLMRESISSYHSAPPPVPSKYGTGSERSEALEPIRYQLHDPDVQWGTASQGRSVNSESGYQTARPPTSRMTTAEDGTNLSYAYRSAMSSISPRSSGYDTAPPPPISRSSVRSEKLSFRSDDQDRAETGTYISEPESDVGLLADLERRSSYGSVAPERLLERGNQSKSYYTAAQWKSESGRTPLGTAQENTLYLTARESTYTTAPSSLAEVTTARGTQE